MQSPPWPTPALPSGWSGPDGADCTDGLVTMDADKSCTATFTLVTHTLTLNKVGTGTGTVTGAGVHNEGSEVAITAVADAGSTFDGWSGPDGADCTDGLVTMDADKSCTATFTLVTHTLTLNKVGTGTGTVTGAGVHNEGSEVAITAVADAGSTFDGWSGPDGADCTDGLVTMDADKSCTATFSQTPPGGDPVQAALDKLSQLRIALNDPDLDLQGDSKSKNKGRNNLRWFNNQLDALEANINAPLFEDALADANNILGKVDGCEAGGAPDPNDKVRTCLDGQDVVDLLVRELILLLEDLVS